MEINQFIENAYKVFSKYLKPDYLTRYSDFEDYEFNKLLSTVSNRELNMDHIGIPTWSPISYLNSQALPYYMPKLIELALAKAIDRDGDPFFLDFINLFNGGPNDERFNLFGHEQYSIISETFKILCDEYSAELEMNGWLDETKLAVKKWKII